jgi:acetyl esterase/lipase
MPSLQARFFNTMVRLLIKRRRWGHDEAALVRRARNFFGTPPVFQRFWTRGVTLRAVNENEVRGEWVEPKHYDPQAVILYLHGGGFISCSAATHRPITTGLARRTKFRVFALNYLLAPEHPFPAGLDSVVAAYKWLLNQNISPAKIALAGDSAGGNLALGLLLRLRDEGTPLPACAVCFSPWADLTGAGDPENKNRCAMFYPENGAEFSAPYLKGAPASDVYASPIFADLGGLPPLLLQVGSTELLLHDSQRLHDKIQISDGTSKLEIFDDVFHCWQMLDGIVPEAGRALQQAVEFIRQNIK